MRINLPVCSDCADYYYCTEPTKTVLHGKMLTPGCRYCMGMKRPRQFKSRAAIIRVPDWCPRRKTPCEVRIYDFRSTNERLMHLFVLSQVNRDAGPEARRYALANEGHTELTPREFWLACNDCSNGNVLDHDVPLYAVVEIDDGLKPYCFYRVESGFCPAPYFNTVTARNNTMEEDA